MTEPSHAVFLSYASQDAEAAQKICEALRVAGIEVWFDQSELRGGDAWDRKIRDQIHDCRLFIPVISANTERRDEGYFRREWALAADRTRDMTHKRTFLVPVVVDGTSERGASVPDKFHELQWTRLPGGDTPPAVVERIRRLLMPEPSLALAAATQTPPASGSGEISTTWFVVRSRYKPGLWAIGAVLAVTMTYFVVDRFWLAKHTAAAAVTATPPSPVAPEKSIAVLPFVDLSEKHDQEYFADGLADEVLSLLATLPELKVISRTSSFQFKGQNTDLRTVGAQLGAAYVVEGSVRRYGDRVRVTAQLITSSDGVHRWSDSYEESIGDVLRMQQNIAMALGRALQVEVSDAPWHAPPTLASSDAYSAYLHGLHAMDRYDPEGLNTAISYFERALSLDPTLVRAREKLAQVYYVQMELGLVSPQISAEHLRQTLVGVLRDDPRSAMGHALQAELLVTYDWDWTQARREAELAVSLSRNCSFALYAAADINGVLGRWDQAEALFRQSLAIDPLDADTHQLFGWTLFHAGRYAEAEAEARRVLQIRPSYTGERFYLGAYLLAQGRFPDALGEMQKEPDKAVRKVGLAMAQYALRNRSEAEVALREAEQIAGSHWAYEIAWTHAFRGEASDAFRWLDRAYEQKDFNLEYLKGEWALKSLESDPRYKAFLRKLNLPE